MFFKDIETERLLLKGISPDDRGFILRQFSNGEVSRCLYDAEPMRTLADADELIAFCNQPEPRAQHRWIITRKTDGQRLGTCGFHCWDRDTGVCELGYDMYPDYWREGCMTEALTAITDFAKQNMGVTRIEAQIFPDNTASVRTALKQGFKPGDKTVTLVFQGKAYVHDIYELILQ